jgi:uncharacterized protein
MPTLYERDSDRRHLGSVRRRKVQFVVITSKFCNLRCSYCYEFSDLNDRTTMSSEQLEQMYRFIADHYYRLDRPVAVEFDWHGGEPLLHGADFYWRTFDQQTKIFDDPQVTVTNCVQTNLTILNDRLIKLLREGFDGVGVSIDLFASARVNAGGRDVQPTVLANMDALREAGVPYGAITVLSRRNRRHLQKIFRFFAEASVSARILPLHRGIDDTQNATDQLSEAELRDAFIELFEMWIESPAPAPIIIEPLHSLAENIIAGAGANGDSKSHYDKRAWEAIYLVNTDGNLYSYADAFDVSMSHGNIFKSSMHELVGGPRHHRAIEAAEARMKAVCSNCRHYGQFCTGYPIAEESFGKLSTDTATCIRERGVLDHIERRLHDLGILNSEGKLNNQSKYFPRFDPALKMPA